MQLGQQGVNQVFRFVGGGDQVGCQSVGSQHVCRGGADGRDFIMGKGAGVLAVLQQTVEEQVYAVGAGEDDPVVSSQVFLCRIQRREVVRICNPDGRHFHHLGAFHFQFFRQGGSLGPCARYDKGFAEERFGLEPAEGVPQFHYFAHDKDGRRFHIGAYHIFIRVAQRGNEGALFRVGAPADQGGRGIGRTAVFD